MTDANINFQLGKLLGEVSNLREDVRRSEDKSDQSRAAMHRRMDDIVSKVGGLARTWAGRREPWC
ncbi:MAG: hypothetical protein JWM58_1652 [Rhizobium sp.]|nr:hypothetical protein [Rhizobium sp.]